MGRITVFLILAVLFVSVRTSKVGGSYGHVKHREVDVPQYAKNPKHNLRKQNEEDNIYEAASDASDNDTEPAFDNPPEAEALAGEDQLNDENNIDTANPPTDGDQEQPETAPGEGNQVDPDKEDPPLEENTNIIDSPDNLDDADGNLVVRGIQAGDTFTPHELLPVTKKLIEKVENPGEGKGIVSSSKSPEALADVLFESFFFGPRRIVTLEEKDIVGLDALQALALSGDEARRMPTQVTAPGYMLNIEDQIVKVLPKSSKYLLLRKSNSSEKKKRNKKEIYKFRSRKDKRMIKRRAPKTSRQNLINKLQKNRKLVLNPVRKNSKINMTKVIKKPAVSKNEKPPKSLVNPVRKNIKHNKTKAIKTSVSTKFNKRVQTKVNSARKNDEINKAKVTKTAALAKGAKPVKGKQTLKINQKNQTLQKLISSKKRTVTSNVAGKPDKGNKQTNTNKNRNKSVMLNRIKGNPATPMPSSETTVHRTSTVCRWRYECTDPGDLDTCKLQTQCNLGNLKATTSADFIGPIKTDEEMRDLRKFHKLIGFSPVDEEVEKILEARILQFRPPVLLEKPARIESLSQYFNNIIVAQLQSTTEPQSNNNYDETTITNLDDKPNNSGPNEAVSRDENGTMAGVLDLDSRRQGSKVEVPHTGRPLLKMY